MCIHWDHSKRAVLEVLDVFAAEQGMAGLLGGLTVDGLGLPMPTELPRRNLDLVYNVYVMR